MFQPCFSWLPVVISCPFFQLGGTPFWTWTSPETGFPFQKSHQQLGPNGIARDAGFGLAPPSSHSIPPHSAPRWCKRQLPDRCHTILSEHCKHICSTPYRKMLKNQPQQLIRFLLTARQPASPVIQTHHRAGFFVRHVGRRVDSPPDIQMSSMNVSHECLTRSHLRCPGQSEG